jgi:hypothetical protein
MFFESICEHPFCLLSSFRAVMVMGEKGETPFLKVLSASRAMLPRRLRAIVAAMTFIWSI